MRPAIPAVSQPLLTTRRSFESGPRKSMRHIPAHFRRRFKWLQPELFDEDLAKDLRGTPRR